MTGGAVSPVPPEARPYQGLRSGVATRVTAGTLDGLVVCAILAACYAGVAGLLFLISPRTFSFPHGGWLFTLTCAFIVLVAYLSLSWWTSGRTYGCLVMGLRVVDRNGRPLGLGRALLRAVLCAVIPLGLIWCAVNRRSNSLQDLLVGTVVIYDWQPRVVTPRNRRPDRET